MKFRFCVCCPGPIQSTSPSVQIRLQIWKSMALERRHLEEQQQRPGREILRNWDDCGEWNLLPWCLPPPQILFHHSPLSLSLSAASWNVSIAASICNFFSLDSLNQRSLPSQTFHHPVLLVVSPYSPALLLFLHLSILFAFAPRSSPPPPSPSIPCVIP